MVENGINIMVEEELYQANPRRHDRSERYKPKSFTESHESYQRAARKETWIHQNNHRTPNHEIVLHYLTEISVKELRERWKKIQRVLSRLGIEFLASLELTLGKNKKPNNTVHYHFLVDHPMSRDELKDMFKCICLCLGLGEKDFSLNFPNKGIYDFGKRKIKYFVKDGHHDKVVLFTTGLRLQKFYHSKNWFLDENGNPTTKAKIYARILNKHIEKKKEPQSNRYFSHNNTSVNNDEPANTGAWDDMHFEDIPILSEDHEDVAWSREYDDALSNSYSDEYYVPVEDDDAPYDQEEHDDLDDTPDERLYAPWDQWEEYPDNYGGLYFDDPPDEYDDPPWDDGEYAFQPYHEIPCYSSFHH